MGALFGNLTRSGIGDSVSSAKYFDSPEAAVSFGSKNLASQGFGAPSVGLSQGAPTVTPGAPAPDEDPMMIQPNQQGQFRAQNVQQQDVLPPNLQSNDKLAMSSPELSGVKLQKPTYAQAAESGKISSAETKGGKLLTLLTAGLRGALAGDPRTSQGYQQAVRMPGIQKKEQLGIEQDQLQNEALKAQAQYAPMLTALGIRGKQAEIKKSEADVANLPIEAALKQAQANAAKYKEVDGVLYDLSGNQPQAVQGAGTLVPLDDASAAAAAVPVGTRVPLHVADKLKKLADTGVHSVSAGGRQLLVDDKGETIKDLGAATPVVVNNLNNPFANVPNSPGTGAGAIASLKPREQALIKGLVNYDIDPNTISTRNNQRETVIALAKMYDPTYDQTQYGTKSALRKSFTSGPDAANITALNTVAHHLDQLDKATDALNGGNVQKLNAIANAYNVKVEGKSAPVVYEAIKNAVSGELGSVYKKSGATDPEIANIGSTIQSSLAKKINKDVIAANVGLVQGRLEALKFKYENGIGKPADFKIASPEAEAAFSRLGGNAGAKQKGDIKTFNGYQYEFDGTQYVKKGRVQ